MATNLLKWILKRSFDFFCFLLPISKLFIFRNLKSKEQESHCGIVVCLSVHNLKVYMMVIPITAKPKVTRLSGTLGLKFGQVSTARSSEQVQNVSYSKLLITIPGNHLPKGSQMCSQTSFHPSMEQSVYSSVYGTIKHVPAE